MTQNLLMNIYHFWICYVKHADKIKNNKNQNQEPVKLNIKVNVGFCRHLFSIKLRIKIILNILFKTIKHNVLRPNLRWGSSHAVCVKHISNLTLLRARTTDVIIVS